MIKLTNKFLLLVCLNLGFSIPAYSATDLFLIVFDVFLFFLVIGSLLFIYFIFIKPIKEANKMNNSSIRDFKARLEFLEKKMNKEKVAGVEIINEDSKLESIDDNKSTTYPESNTMGVYLTGKEDSSNNQNIQSSPQFGKKLTLDIEEKDRFIKLFSAPPNERGVFNNKWIEKEFNSTISVYEFDLPESSSNFESNKDNVIDLTNILFKEGASLFFSFVKDQDTVERAVNSPESYIIPACENNNAFTKNTRTIETIKKGVAIFEGGNWKVNQKAKIEYK